MAVRASSDNLSLDIPSDAGAPTAPVVDFSEVWAHRESLRQACTRLIGDPSRAEDLVQETFLSALKSGRSLERRESMGPWLATVARRRSIDELRGRRKLAVVPSPPEPEPTVLDDPAEQFLSSELVTQLRQAIADLTPRERQLLLRQAHHGLSLSELAAEEETSVASVRSVLTRARQKVRMSLERGGALGGLPLPRWLLSLREKTVRWALLWEPSLPSLTGAGAQVTSAIVAVVTAVAMMLGNAGPFHGPDQSLTMIGTDGGSALADTTAGGGGAADAAAHRRTSVSHPSEESRTAGTQNAALGSALPAPVDVSPSLPPNHHTTPDKTGPEEYAASETGGHVYALDDNSSGTVLQTVMFRSTDSGASWSQVSTFNYKLEGRIILPPTYPAQPTIFIAAGTHLLRSDDAGSKFVPVAPSRGRHSVMLSPTFLSDARIFIAGTPFLVYDAEQNTLEPLGTTNAPMNSNMTLTRAATYGTDEAVLVGGTARVGTSTKNTSAVYRCTPTACGPPVTLPIGNSAPALVRLASGSLLTYHTTPYAFYRSTDDGASFQQLTLPTGFHPSYMFELTAGELIIGGGTMPGTVTGLFRSTDEGTTLTAIGGGTDMEGGGPAMIPLPTGALLGTPYPLGRGIRCSHDGGNTWARRC